MPSSSKPTPPSGSDPKQAIEAKLNSYLEGTLAVSEQAEIESYLQSSPQHRQLLRELRATRELLRQLPRESAPPEIAEAFEQQMERSMLLDDLAIDAAPAGRGGPQKMLLAALVLLAAGLGTVIYLALPGPGSSTQRLTALGPLPEGAAATSQPVGPPLESSAMVSPPATTLPAVAEAVAPVAAAARAAAPKQMDAAQSAVAAMTPAAGFAQRVLDRQAAGSQPTALLTLVSDDPAAPQAVADYFRSSVISFQRTDTPATRPAIADLTLVTTQPSTRPADAMAFVAQNSAKAGPTTVPVATPNDAGVPTFVARNLAPREAMRLQTELAATYGTAAVKFYAPAAKDAPSGTPSTAAVMTVAADESLSVTVDQLVGPGVEKTNLVRVGADGSVMLPMLMEPVPAAGLTFAELQARISDRYRGANLISHPTVTVVQAPADAGPQASAGANAPASTEASVETSTEPTAGSAAAPTTGPTTAAASALTDGEQVMNLVVMILPSTGSPTTHPTGH